MNVHTPERFPGESIESYKARRQQSAQLVKLVHVRDFSTRQLTGEAMTLAGHRTVTSSRKQHRDAMRASGAMKKRTRYADGIARLQAKHNRSNATAAYPHDAHGAFTLIGRNNAVHHGTRLVSWYAGERRMWLGGISAQRGY